MKKLLQAVAILVIAMSAAHATLVTLGAPYWPPAGSSGLGGVEFNVVNGPGGAFVALGAHPYKHGATMPNDGVSTFYGNTGTYPGEPNRANWSFDWAFNVGSCTTCSLLLEFDNDPSAAQNWTSFGQTPVLPAGTWASDSWNLEMGFLQALMGPFDPNASGSYSFRETIFEGQRAIASTLITVNVPEPGTILLLLIGLAGIAYSTRKIMPRLQRSQLIT